MGQVTAKMIVSAPVEAVWNCLNDIDNTPRWVVGLERAEWVTKPPVAVGSIYIDYNRLGPFPQVTPWHVRAFQPMSHMIHESESALLPSRMTINIKSVLFGTEVEMIVEYRFLPKLGIISRVFESWVMNRALPQVLKQNLLQMEAYLQQQDARTHPIGQPA